MSQPLSPWMLGATLYMPATRGDLADVILHGKISQLRSLVICLEDAVSERDVTLARDNLQTLLRQLQQQTPTHTPPLVFIRPRDEAMAAALLHDSELSGIDGFVLPKFNQANVLSWWRLLAPTSLLLMPTLETRDVFDSAAMQQLASLLEQHPCRERILALRIGGNDLMSVLGLRRSRHLTLYEGPLGYVVKMLVATFASRGFALTAPVCERIEDVALLERELALDVAHGLVGKTAIHPAQLEIIQRGLMAEQSDYEDALRIMNSEQAVFKSQGAMCEPATHRNWAAAMLERSAHCGIVSAYTGAVYAQRQ